jgi:4-amino-4-deoxy-L-arabinose transferase-like glycosyltransferase
MNEAASRRQDVTASPASENGEDSRRLRVMKWVIVGLSACIFALRLVAPPNLLDQDQERPACYVLDAVRNGNWLCQRDLSGDITSKPPLWTWVAGVTAVARGRVDEFAIYFPGALAGTGVALLVLFSGCRRFNPRAGFFAALACLFTTAAFKQFGLARTDGVFALTVTLTALAAFRAWTTGRGWLWFWLAGAAATLTKGPLGLVLGALGLLAAWWESRTISPPSEEVSSAKRFPKGEFLAGACVYVLLVGGWFLLSYLQLGYPLIAKMLGKELVGHVVTDGKKHYPGMLIYQQPLYYLGRAAPWSFLAYFGLWRLWRRPAVDRSERIFERFLFCWFLGGLLIFSLAPHQRADLLWPILPAGALIAGRELQRTVAGQSPRKIYGTLSVLLALGFGYFTLYYGVLQPKTRVIKDTVATEKLAWEITGRVGSEFPFTHVDDRAAFQVYLNTLRPQVSFSRAARLLGETNAAFVVVKDRKKLEAERKPDDPPMFLLFSPGDTQSVSPVYVFGNRPILDSSGSFTFCHGPLCFRAREVRVLQADERAFRFEAHSDQAQVEVINECSEPKRVRLVLELKAGNSSRRVERLQMLEPGAQVSADLKQAGP